MFSLADGSINLDPDNVRPESVSAGVDLADFAVRAEFGNPVNANFRPYSYGVKFRETSEGYQAVIINSSGEVKYVTGVVGAEGELDSFTEVMTFDYDDIAEGGSESNSLDLFVIDDLAWLYINGEYITEFTVTGIGVSADVEFIAEIENETDIQGVFTELTNAEVRSGEVAAFISAGEIVKESGEIARTTATGPISDMVVEAEFISPYERVLDKWSVGFEYHDPVTGTTNWLIIDNSRQWRHIRQIGVDGELEELSSGIHNGILRDRGDLNTIKMIGNNGNFQVFINDVFIAEIDFGEGEIPAQVAAIAGFDPVDQNPGVPTRFNNYTVWSFGS